MRTPGGYDAYFAESDDSEASSRIWRETVTGRGTRHQQPTADIPTARPHGDVAQAAVPEQMPGSALPGAPAANSGFPSPSHTSPVNAGFDQYAMSGASTLPPAAAPAPPPTAAPPAVRWPDQAIPMAAPPASERRGGQESDRVEVFPIALTSAELLADIAASRQAHLRSTAGMRGALNKVGFNIGLSPAEQATENRHGRIRRQLTATYQIAVLNVKGGAGRTTTVATLGSTFAALRPDRVVAIDANPDFGDLSSRTNRHPYGLTLRDLAQEPQLDAFSAVQSFAAITSANLAVVASPWSTAAVAALSGPEYLSAVTILRRHYNLLVVDCGTGVFDSATTAVLESSDAVVVVTPATVRGVTGAVATLEWLNSHGQYRLAAKSTIAIVHQHPAKPVVETARIEELFATAQRPTFVIPYDQHLTEGGEIDLRLLDSDTALAFEELAATLADGFPATLTTGYTHHTRGGWQ